MSSAEDSDDDAGAFESEGFPVETQRSILLLSVLTEARSQGRCAPRPTQPWRAPARRHAPPSLPHPSAVASMTAAIATVVVAG